MPEALGRLSLYPSTRAALDEAVRLARQATNESGILRLEAGTLRATIEEYRTREKLIESLARARAGEARTKGFRDGLTIGLTVAAGLGIGWAFGKDLQGAGLGALIGGGLGSGIVLIAFPIAENKSNR